MNRYLIASLTLLLLTACGDNSTSEQQTQNNLNTSSENVVENQAQELSEAAGVSIEQTSSTDEAGELEAPSIMPDNIDTEVVDKPVPIPFVQYLNNGQNVDSDRQLDLAIKSDNQLNQAIKTWYEVDQEHTLFAFSKTLDSNSLSELLFSKTASLHVDEATGRLVDQNGYFLQSEYLYSRWRIYQNIDYEFGANNTYYDRNTNVPSCQTNLPRFTALKDNISAEEMMTDEVSVKLNIPSSDYSPAGSPMNFDVNDQLTYHHSTESTVYNSIGEAHQLSLYFVQGERVQYRNNVLMFLAIDGQPVNVMGFDDEQREIPGSEAGQTAAVLTFDEYGELIETYPQNIYTQLVNTDNTNAVATSQNINTLSIGVIQEQRIDIKLDVTAYGANFQVALFEQNGYPSISSLITASEIDLLGTKKMTTEVLMKVNLPAGDYNTPADFITSFHPDDDTTYHYKADKYIFDSTGEPHILTFYYLKIADDEEVWYYGNTWGVFVTLDGTPVNIVFNDAITNFEELDLNSDGFLSSEELPAQARQRIYVPTNHNNNINKTSGLVGTVLSFTASGALEEISGEKFILQDLKKENSTGDNPYTFENLANQIITVKTPIGPAADSPTQFASNFEAGEIQQNGRPISRFMQYQGSLSSSNVVDICENKAALFYQSYSNRPKVTANLKLFTFDNPEQLTDNGNGYWYVETDNEISFRLGGAIQSHNLFTDE